MTNKYLKPSLLGDGSPALVRDPETYIPLDPDGEWKVMSPFWTRRLRDKDVIEAEPASAASVTPATPLPAPTV